MREALRRLNVEEAGLKAYAALAKSEEARAKYRKVSKRIQQIGATVGV